MSQAANRPVNKCVYCGKRMALEADHIPPACLFPSPRPSNLITVPSCSWCNRGASQDDEYFRMILIMRRDAQHPAARKLLEPVNRGLGKPRKRGMLHALLRTMREVEVRTSSGLYLGQATTYNADLQRMERVTNRIVRGLFWKTYGYPLPSTHDVRSFAQSGFRDLGSDMETTVAETVATLTSTEAINIGSGVFRYWHQATEVDPATTVWLFRFYDLESFMCISAPRGQ